MLQCNSAAHQITTQNNTTTIHRHVPTVPAVLPTACLLPAPYAVVQTFNCEWCNYSTTHHVTSRKNTDHRLLSCNSSIY